MVPDTRQTKIEEALQLPTEKPILEDADILYKRVVYMDAVLEIAKKWVEKGCYLKTYIPSHMRSTMKCSMKMKILYG